MESSIASLILQGWRNERVVCMPKVEGGRIVLVLDSDPVAQRKKVKILGF